MIRLSWTLRRNSNATHILETSSTAPEISRSPRTVVCRPTDRAAELAHVGEECSEFRWFSAAYVSAINRFRRFPLEHLVFICDPHYRAIDGEKCRGETAHFIRDFPRSLPDIRHSETLRKSAEKCARAMSFRPLEHTFHLGEIPNLFGFPGDIIAEMYWSSPNPPLNPLDVIRDFALDIGVIDRSHRLGLADRDFVEAGACVTTTFDGRYLVVVHYGGFSAHLHVQLEGIRPIVGMRKHARPTKDIVDLSSDDDIEILAESKRQRLQGEVINILSQAAIYGQSAPPISGPNAVKMDSDGPGAGRNSYGGASSSTRGTSRGSEPTRGRDETPKDANRTIPPLEGGDFLSPRSPIADSMPSVDNTTAYAGYPKRLSAKAISHLPTDPNRPTGPEDAARSVIIPPELSGLGSFATMGPSPTTTQRSAGLLQTSDGIDTPPDCTPWGISPFSSAGGFDIQQQDDRNPEQTHRRRFSNASGLYPQRSPPPEVNLRRNTQFPPLCVVPENDTIGAAALVKSPSSFFVSVLRKIDRCVEKESVLRNGIERCEFEAREWEFIIKNLKELTLYEEENSGFLFPESIRKARDAFKRLTICLRNTSQNTKITRDEMEIANPDKWPLMERIIETFLDDDPRFGN